MAVVKPWVTSVLSWGIRSGYLTEEVAVHYMIGERNRIQA